MTALPETPADPGQSTESLKPGTPGLGQLRAWALEFGFSELGVADLDVSEAAPGFDAWLEAQFHGEMDYMARHRDLRFAPQSLVPGAVRAVMVSVDYAPGDEAWVARAWQTLAEPERAFVSRYALGRDYHKLVRSRLARLARRMAGEGAMHGWRVFCDSAPVLEVELARKAGLGWRGKHTLLLSRQGSMRFIGTIYTDMPLDLSAPVTAHCGHCERCLEVCPTGAIVAPYRLDARRCISYLTIELAGPIPPELRPAIGNRIYGCDDCQLACPWNGFARPSQLPDFAPREGLDTASLLELFAWSAEAFEQRLQGSAIRRIGHERWLRNLAVALGNAPASPAILRALESRREHPSALVREHVEWAIARQLSAPMTTRMEAQSPPQSSTP